MMGVLYNVESHTVTYDIQKTFKLGELEEASIVRFFRVTWTNDSIEEFTICYG